MRLLTLNTQRKTCQNGRFFYLWENLSLIFFYDTLSMVFNLLMATLREGLTFDDVLLVPRKSRVFSRKDISLQTQFSRHIKLSMPLVSANMDTVTESQMARFMAEAGGIGIIHRFLPIEHQVEEVRRVKRAENVIIDDPYTIEPHHTLAYTRDYMAQLGISGLLVTDEKKRLVGIVTSRDLMLESDIKRKIRHIMTTSVISAHPTITLDNAKELLLKNRIEKLPLVSKNGVIKGLITLKDILKRAQNPAASKDKRGRLLVGAALGIKDDIFDRAKALLDTGVDVLVLDVAHGHTVRVIDAVKSLRGKFGNIEIVAGNVATADGVKDLVRAGVDGVKVGIGPGAACTTRIVAGVGVPQLTALLDAKRTSKKSGIPIIADGGIKNSGDFAKAIATGAETVMIGSLLAGTEEAPGEYMIEDGAAFKLYRGMASREASQDKIRIDNTADGFERAPEGRSGRVSYRGHAQKVISDLTSGLRSAMSYLGAENLRAFHNNADFIKISKAGYKEGLPRNNG